MSPHLVLLWAACTGAPEGGTAPAPGPDAGEAEAPCHDELAAAPATAASLYDLDLPLETSTGAAVGLDVHRGRPVLLSMVYATCTDVCPATVAVLRDVRARIPDARRDEVRILLVSLDPERDTPQALSALAERHGLGPEWTLARTPPDRVRELAAALGVRYRPRPDGGIDHSTVVALLDENGVVRARLDALSQPPDPLLEALAGS